MIPKPWRTELAAIAEVREWLGKQRLDTRRVTPVSEMAAREHVPDERFRWDSWGRFAVPRGFLRGSPGSL